MTHYTSMQRDFLTLSQMTEQDCVSIAVSTRAQERLLKDLAWAMDRILPLSSALQDVRSHAEAARRLGGVSASALRSEKTAVMRPPEKAPSPLETEFYGGAD